MPYEDGARTIFLYTRGKKGRVPEKLRQLLEYFENTTEKHAESEDLQQLHQLVERVKKDEEVSADYMLWSEREQMWEENGYERGRAEERKRTEEERKRTEEERKRTEVERLRAEAALKENEALKKELARLRAQIVR